MLKNPRIGQEVYYKAPYIDMDSGIITEICDGELTGYVKIEGKSGTQGAKLKDVYETKQALLDGLALESEKQIKKYCAEIKDVKDLVQFMYNEGVAQAEEYTDWDARNAARIRAKELLGIDLEMESNGKIQAKEEMPELGDALDALQGVDEAVELL